MLVICKTTPLLLMWMCTYWPLTLYWENKRSNQLSPPWMLIGMDHCTLWAMVSFINIWSPLKWFLSILWNFADEASWHVDQILCVASLGWGKGKGCIRFWGRLDQNSGFYGNRKPPLTYNGENDVSTFSRLFLIRSCR